MGSYTAYLYISYPHRHTAIHKIWSLCWESTPINGFEPGVSQNIALHALPTARNSAFLFSDLPPPSPFPTQSVKWNNWFRLSLVTCWIDFHPEISFMVGWTLNIKKINQSCLTYIKWVVHLIKRVVHLSLITMCVWFVPRSSIVQSCACALTGVVYTLLIVVSWHFEPG